MTAERLVALLDDQEIGTLERDRRGRLDFKYDAAWRASPDAYPLSLSLPLATNEHRPERIEAFISGLLPDNEQILQRWARRFQVSARSAFALISRVGEDCAGAVRFVRPERLDAVRAGKSPDVRWLNEAGVAARIRALRLDHAAWRIPGDTGQFSLAGAQPKTALIHDNGRWGIPAGRTPTTHILKPPTGEFDGHAENEHFCLTLARALRLPAASSVIRRFGDEIAIVVERYDRVRMAAAAGARERNGAAKRISLIRRVHQEDMCQALGLPPTAKYQNEGGPSPEAIATLLDAHSSRSGEDVGTFVDALAFNWLIGGTDAHAKNYSILHGGGGRVRLAPFYDIASALPYDDLDPKRIKLAMRIGGEYRLRDIGPRQWRKLATELGLEPGRVAGRVGELATAMRTQVPIVRDQIEQQGLPHPIVDRLAAALAARTEQCLRSLRG